MTNKPTDCTPVDTDWTPEENFKTKTGKIDYAEYTVTQSLFDITQAITRLSRLHHLLLAGKDDLPDIILHNELRMALKPMIQVTNDLGEVTDTLRDMYRGVDVEDEVPPAITKEEK